MKIKFIKIKGYKNLDFEVKFPDDGVAVLIGNNGSGKSNVLEAISKIFGFYYKDILQKKYKENLFSNLSFEYEIVYEKNSKEETLTNSIEKVDEKLLPKKIYAIYSGEDLKLWQCYFPFYESYIRRIKNKQTGKLPFVYINKYFWDIAILTLLLFGEDLSDLKLKALKNIKFNFNKNLFKCNIKNNKIVNFVKKISKDKKEAVFNFSEFKDLYDYELRNVDLDSEKEQYQEFFELLMAAYLPDEELRSYKFIDVLDLSFEGKIDIFNLSEGEKKIILLKLLFNILIDENSILLLDEPDDNIHPANKERIKELIFNCKLNHKNIVIATHSPTLTHFFDTENIFMIDRGRIINKDKKEIIEFLTDKNWTYQDINIILSSSKDVFLVEGKTDELFLQTALEIFQKEGEFNSLNFDYIPVGGASGMKLFLEKFKTNEDRKVFVLLDSDYAGDKSLKKFLTENKINQLKKEGKLIESDFILIYLPKPDFISHNEYEIEDLFPYKLTKTLFMCKIRNNLKNVKNIRNFPQGGRKLIKTLLEEEVESFKNNNDSMLQKESFKEFKKIFKIIEKIKNENF